MKTSIIFADGLTQINFTPENDNEKMALKLINAKNQMEVAVHNRTFSDEDSKMIVLKPRKKETDESDFQKEVDEIKKSLISTDNCFEMMKDITRDHIQIHRDAKECLMILKYWDDHSIVTYPDRKMVHPLIQDSNVSKVIKTFLEKLINKFPNK